VVRAGRENLSLSALHHLREPPVQDLDLAVLAEHDVGRLQVAVEDAARVREVDRLRDLQQDLHEAGEGVAGRRLRVASAQPGEDVRERAAAHVPHRAERSTVVDDERVEGDHVRVLELAQDPHLVEEARAAARVVALDHLQRDLAAERRVPRDEDGAHPALGEELHDVVPHLASGLARRVGRESRALRNRAVRRRGEGFLFGRVAVVAAHGAPAPACRFREQRPRDAPVPAMFPSISPLDCPRARR
jgi:hypothetical protein